MEYKVEKRGGEKVITKDDIIIVFNTTDGSEALFGFRACDVNESFSEYQRILYNYIEKNYKEVATVELDETTSITVYVKNI
jgi:hypothetical protein